VAIKLGRASSDFVGVSVLLGVVMGIGPFAGLVSLAYSVHDGFLVVVVPEILLQSR